MLSVFQLWKLLAGDKDMELDGGNPNGLFSFSKEKARGVPGSPSSKIMETCNIEWKWYTPVHELWFKNV